MARRLVVVVLISLGLGVVLCVATVAAQASVPDDPTALAISQGLASDSAVWASGWITVAQGRDRLLQHDLGGDLNDYAVDLWFWDVGAMEGSGLGIHTFGYGGFENGDLWRGAYWSDLTTSQIRVTRLKDDETSDYVFVRIRIVDSDAYNQAASKWKEMLRSGDGAWTFRHDLGGNPEDYTVGVWFRNEEDGSIHNHNFGGLEFDHQMRGGHWQNLTDETINLIRWEHDEIVEEARVRIIKNPPTPAYDSDWQAIDADEVLTLTHGLGGQVASYRVNLQYRDLTQTQGMGIHAFGAGGVAIDNTLIGSKAYGGHWQRLTNSTIQVYRQPDGTHPTEVRVRIWADVSRVYLPLVIR